MSDDCGGAGSCQSKIYGSSPGEDWLMTVSRPRAVVILVRPLSIYETECGSSCEAF